MDGRILSYPSNIVSIEPVNPPATEIENKNISRYLLKIKQ